MSYQVFLNRLIYFWGKKKRMYILTQDRLNIRIHLSPCRDYIEMIIKVFIGMERVWRGGNE